MADKRYNLVFDAKLEIGQIKQAIGQISQSLNSTSVNLPKGISSALEKTLKTVQAELLKMEGLSGEKLTLQNSKEIGKSYETILRNFQTLKVLMSDIKSSTAIDPEKLFPSEIADKIKGANDALKAYKAAIEKGPKTEAFQQLTKELAAAQKKYEELNSKINTATSKQQTTKSVRQQIDEEKRPYQEIIQLAEKEAQAADRVIAKSKEKLKSKKSEATITKAITVEEEKLQNAQKRAAEIQAKMDSKKRKDTKVYADLEADLAKQQEKIQQSKQLIAQYQQERDSIVKLNEEIAAAERAKTAALTQGREAQKKVNELERRGTTKDDQYRQATADLQLYTDQAKKTEEEIRRLQEEKKRMEQAFSQGAMNTLVEEFKKLGIEIPETSRNLGDIQKILDNLSVGAVQKLEQELNKAGASLEDFGLDLTRIGNKKQELDKLTDAQKKFNDELEMVKSRVTYFFGLTNSVNLLKRALSGAFETVKELDAQMVETAVVTDFSVSDMWEKLPEYTKQAGTLGAKVIDLYDATTLYYQQGLKTNEAMALGTETMKMARIAGMESAEATEAMTAALRGFNMELNETSATRVNDVYSELAAITAADTEQIATAMGKTASIAASANMEFETTAALLAQIIETTQEAPETAGTAMKTIIARFTEVKELFSQGQLTGEDSEGEEININKIDAALKTVGISLKDFLNGSKGIDDIFLELGAKWDSLDLATQRYIATMAAGSRQQSRFIAMMSDHERTMELVSAANNSAGASQEQFEKTTEGLQASLNKLSNAWEEFLMGLANETVIKDVIDVLTTLLNLINDLTSVWGKAGGSETLLLRLGITAAGFKVAKVAIAKGLNSFASTFAGAGASNGLSFWQAFVSKKSLRAARNGLIAQKGVFQNFKRLWGVNGKGFVADTQAIQGMTFGTKEYGEEILRLKTKYQLTDDQAQSFSQTLQNNGQVSDWAKQQYNEQTNAMRGSIQGYREQEAAIKKAQTAQIKSIATMVGITIAIYAITKAAEIAKKTLDETITTSQEKIESLEKVEENLVKETEELQDNLKNFGKIRTGFDEMIDQLGDLQKGTAEWASTMHEARTQMYNILQTYPDLSNYVTTLDNGLKVFTEEGWAAYEQKLIEDLNASELLLIQNQMQQQQVKSEQAAENLKIPTSSISDKEAAGIEKGTTTGTYVGGAAGAVGGWVAGTAIGLKAGAGLGSAIAPGLGTIIGALVGVLLGALVGHLAGGGLSAIQGVSVDTVNNAALKAADEGFSAEAAMREENGEEIIKQFLEDSGLQEGTEEFTMMLDYITGNAAEFDAHTIAIKENQAALIQFGKTLGLIQAERQGYTGQDAETFSDIYSTITSESYDLIYDRQYKKITNDYLVTGKGREEVAKASGYYWDSANNEWLYSEGGNKVDNFSVEEQRAIVAQSRTIAELTGVATNTFNGFVEVFGGEDSQIAGRITGEAGKNNVGKLTAEQAAEVTSYIPAVEKVLKNYSFNDQLGLSLELEKSGIDTGLQISWEADHNTRSFLDEGGEGHSTTTLTTDVDQAYAEAYGNIENTSKLAQKHMDSLNDDWNLFGWEWATVLHDSYSFKQKNQNDRFSYAVDEKGLYQGVANDSKLTLGIVEAYVDNNLDSYFNIPELQALQEKAEPYIQQMSFLSKVPLDTVIAFGDRVQQIQNDLDLNDLEKGDNYFTEAMNTIFSGITEETTKNLVANTITSLDFTNLTELRATEEWLKELPGVSSKASEAFGQLATDFSEAGIAFARIDLETVKKQLENTFNIIDKIDDLEASNELKLTAEELEGLLDVFKSAGEDVKRDDFVKTSEGFVYLGDNISDLRDTILRSNDILLNLQIDALRSKVNTGSFVEKAVANNTSQNANWSTLSTATNDQLQDAMDMLINEGARQIGVNIQDYENATHEEKVALAEKLGSIDSPLKQIDSDTLAKFIWSDSDFDFNTTENAGVASVIKELMVGWGDAYTNLGDETNPAEGTYRYQLNQGLLDEREQQLSYLSGQELVDTARETPEDKVAAEKILDYKIQDGDLEAELEGTVQGLAEENSELAKNKNLVKAAIIDSATYEKRLSALAQQLSDNKDILKSSNKESKEYQKALDRVTSAAEDAFGENITEDFVEANLDAFLDWAEGGEGSAERLRQAIVGNLSTALNVSADMATGISNVIAGLDNLNFDIYGHADASQIFTELAAVMGSAEAAEEALKVLGYKITWEENGTVPLDILNPETGEMEQKIVPNYKVVLTDGLGNVRDRNKVDYGGGGKKGGGGSKKEDWKNPYDKHYNTLEQINEALREREKLERRYQRLLEQSNTKGGDLVKNAEQQIEKAEDEIALRKKLRNQRAEQIQEEIDKKGLGKYYSVTENEYGEYEIRIDWEAINAVKDEDKGQKIEDSISDLEGWRDDINEQNDTIEDIYDEIQEIRHQGEDEYFDLETRIKDALVQAQQDEIDKLSEINTSINDTNARLLETMQYNLEQERQMRENDKTEQELEDKQRRLEYLSQDTSGANALEIEQLQKEIDEGRESYTDTLIDQKINELQHQNDEAAEQRQRQIDIAQSQLDHYVKTGEIWNNVYSLMESDIGADGIIPGSELENLLKDNEDWAGKSVMEQLQWGNELKDTVAQAIQYLKVGNSTESLIKSKELKVGESVNFTTSDGVTLSGKVSENGDIVADGKTYKDVYRNYDGNYVTDEAYQGRVTEPSEPETPKTEEKKEIKVGGKINAGDAKIYKASDSNEGYRQLYGNDPIYDVLAEKNGRVQVRYHKLKPKDGITGWFKKNEVKAYKTGGLADYTGPAWLDGTKSKPELVLNAQDTQNFIQLKNVLASLMSGTGKSAENIGDSTYDIDINVESIGSDYDVEQMAEKIKNLINQDARYRNNNTVSLMR